MKTKGQRPNLRVIASIVLVVSAINSAGCAQRQPDPEVPVSAPEAEGFSSSRLAELIDFARTGVDDVHSLLVARHGSLIMEAYFEPFQAEMLHDVASVTKSVVALLTLLAVEDGYIPDLDSPALTLLPSQYAGVGRDDSRRITVRDLLDMRSGWDCGLAAGERELEEMRRTEDWITYAFQMEVVDQPGQRFSYCSSNFHVLSAILSATTGESAAEYAQHRLFDPLGISEFVWPEDPRGTSHGWGDLALRSSDMLKIGLLLAADGRWGSEQLVPENWVDQIAGTPSSSDYRLGWWREGDGMWRFEANGRGGQRITVIPELEVVVVMTGGGFEPGTLGGGLLAALLGDSGLDPDPEGEAELRRALARAAQSAVPTPVEDLSGWRELFDGTLYEMEPNEIGIDSLRLSVQGEDGLLTLWPGLGEVLHQPVGLDGRYRLAEKDGIATAARARRIDEETVRLDLNMLSRINHYRLDLIFGDDGIIVDASESTQLGRARARGVKGS